MFFETFQLAPSYVRLAHNYLPLFCIFSVFLVFLNCLVFCVVLTVFPILDFLSFDCNHCDEKTGVNHVVRRRSKAVTGGKIDGVYIKLHKHTRPIKPSLCSTL